MNVIVKAKVVIKYRHYNREHLLQLKYKWKTSKWGFYTHDSYNLLRYSATTNDEFTMGAYRYLTAHSKEGIQMTLKNLITDKIPSKNSVNRSQLKKSLKGINKDLSFTFVFKE